MDWWRGLQGGGVNVLGKRSGGVGGPAGIAGWGVGAWLATVVLASVADNGQPAAG